MIDKIIIASNNEHKVREFKRILDLYDVTLVTQKELNIEDIEETGLSFLENAILKARNASEKSGLPAISDDSGIEVDALQGRPGIYSARYSGKDATDEKNNKLLLKEMESFGKDQRTARYQCVIAFVNRYDDPMPKTFYGTWEGYIAEKPSGSNGFGYDPLFYLPEHSCTSAELTKEKKNKISHRAKALVLFQKYWEDLNTNG
tara:strand:+ start:3883 stop:4491 length:609 start_codon:yes stop_codon:yes gene_type:complete